MNVSYNIAKGFLMKTIKKIITLMAAVTCLPCLLILGHVMILLRRRPIRRFYEERRREPDYIPLSRMPEKLVHFTLQIEDDEFYDHSGYNREGIRDAIFINLKNKKVITGGSTLTQQLVKNLYFTFEKSYLRKIEEFLITTYTEHTLTKDEIFELYMNVVYFGSGVDGITHAARLYFDKNVEDLTANQMFLLVSLLYAPTKSNPLWYPDVLERIRDKKLALLVRRGTISDEDYKLISSCHADCLDPELQTRKDIVENYPRDIRLVNDRFGPAGDRKRVTIP